MSVDNSKGGLRGKCQLGHGGHAERNSTFTRQGRDNPMDIGIIGYGRIGAHLHEKLKATPGVNVCFVYEKIREKTKNLDRSLVIENVDDLSKKRADLVVECADFTAVASLAPLVLNHSNMLILSASAFADDKLEASLRRISTENDRRIYIPHGALLGMDGFQDAKSSFSEVTITTTKAPKNLDFTFQTRWKQEEIKTRTVLHDGNTRECCKLFPRNVNSHAVLALSCLGFDRTRSVLIADPQSTVASHHIVATGGGTTTEIMQASQIKGVTGDYTLASVYGTILRILSDKKGVNIV